MPIFQELQEDKQQNYQRIRQISLQNSRLIIIKQSQSTHPISQNYKQQYIIIKYFIKRAIKMNITQQGILLRMLYQKKYVQQSKLRNQVKKSQQLCLSIKSNSLSIKNKANKSQNIFLNFGEQSQQKLEQIVQKYKYKYQQRIGEKEEQKYKSLLSLQKPSSNKIYDFSYCNQPLQLKPKSYRQFAQSKDKQKRRVKSVAAPRSVSNSKADNCRVNAKYAILHPRQSHYIMLLNQRKKKHKLNNLLSLDSPLQSVQYGNTNNTDYRNKKYFMRNTISQVRKRTTITVLRNRNRSNRASDIIKGDDNDVLPWNVDPDQFLYKQG